MFCRICDRFLEDWEMDEGYEGCCQDCHIDQILDEEGSVEENED